MWQVTCAPSPAARQSWVKLWQLLLAPPTEAELAAQVSQPAGEPSEAA